jgi:saccharopine dehydrogenase-like NADP-dependent oxidoreductase
MKQKIAVLGAGMVGRAMAIDLSSEFQVTSVDVSSEALDKLGPVSGINKQIADLSNSKEIQRIAEDQDLVIGAVPGFMGFETLKFVIETGKNVVDISFFDEDPFLLDELAKEKGVVAIMDCGVAPGMDNVILGYHWKQMEVENFVCLVGGLPKTRTWPYEYKAPFSPIDVIEEYTRPARIVEDGKVVVKVALSEPELINFEGIGTLEAFNSDGLRSLVKTINVPNMIERTLRYPGHIEIMRVLRDTGFFEKEESDVKGQKIRPLDLTTILLFPKWKLGDEEKEFTVMRVIVEGNENGKAVKYTYDLHDTYNEDTKTSSMARTTGYTCTSAARMVLAGEYNRKGISPPEYLGFEKKNFEFMMKRLEERNVKFRCTVS